MEMFNLVYDHILIDSRKRNRDCINGDDDDDNTAQYNNNNDNSSSLNRNTADSNNSNKNSKDNHQRKVARSNTVQLSNKEVVVCKVIAPIKNTNNLNENENENDFIFNRYKISFIYNILLLLTILSI